MSRLRLYDLGNAKDQSTSPYGWRIHESMHLLSLSYHTERLGFTEIQHRFSERHTTVPVLVDGELELSDSWAIANYLADNYDPNNILFGGAAGYSLSCFVAKWVDACVVGNVNKIIVMDIYNGCRNFDQAYFRAKEEKRFGQTLEDLHKNRKSELPVLQNSLHPARQLIKGQNFLGGESPTFADFSLHSIFQWSRRVSKYPLLRADDRLQDWINRMDEWTTAPSRRA